MIGGNCGAGEGVILGVSEGARVKVLLGVEVG